MARFSFLFFTCLERRFRFGSGFRIFVGFRFQNRFPSVRFQPLDHHSHRPIVSKTRSPDRVPTSGWRVRSAARPLVPGFLFSAVITRVRLAAATDKTVYGDWQTIGRIPEEQPTCAKKPQSRAPWYGSRERNTCPVSARRGAVGRRVYVRRDRRRNWRPIRPIRPADKSGEAAR